MPGSSVARALTSLRLRAADLADVARGRRDPLVPPRRLNFVGDSDFVATGEEFRRHFRELAGLRAEDRVLDVGCGIGRMARVLATELVPPGTSRRRRRRRRSRRSCRARYDGRTRAPFRFAHADLHHPVYNPQGTGAADTFRFPYPDGSFDLVIATSVFTHLLAAPADRYLAEIARVLAPGGRSLTTWLLLDPTHPPGAAAAWSFEPAADGVAHVADPSDPEAAVAYELGWLESHLAAHGLTPEHPVEPGSWTGRPGRSFQDLVLAGRP